MTKRWVGLLSLTALVGCSGSSGELPAGPFGAQSTIVQCGIAGEPCCSGASCDAGPACVGAQCSDSSTEAAAVDAPPFDDAGSAVLDSTMGTPSVDEASLDVAVSVFDTSAGPEASTDGAGEVAESAPDDAEEDAGSLDLGLVALYHFDETSGTVAADSSGNGNTATMQGGATFSPGVRGNAATFNGASQYVSLPAGIVSALTSFSIASWIYQSVAGSGDRLFDFGTGTTVNMFITTDGDVLRYAVTTGGHKAEEDLLTSGDLPVGVWQHLAVTQAAETATLYLNGAVVSLNTATTLDPSSLGVTTQDWIGRSQYADNPTLTGQVDEFRIYNRTLSPAEVTRLYLERR